MNLEGIVFQYVVNLVVEREGDDLVLTCVDEALLDLNRISTSVYATGSTLLDDLETSEAIDEKILRGLRLQLLREEQEEIKKKIQELENEQ